MSAASDFLARIRERAPRIHCLSNPVSLPALANLLKGLGASPVMAEAPEEAAEISAQSDALYLNMGCLTQDRLEAMRRAGRAARSAGLPVVLDPVGAGLSAFRRRALEALTEELRPLLLKGNLSELRFWARPERGGGAIDSELRALSPEERAELRRAAARQGAFLLASGPSDYVFAPWGESLKLDNGHPLLAGFSGSGCLLGGLATAFLAVAKEDEKLAAVRDAAAALGIAGERIARAGGGEAARAAGGAGREEGRGRPALGPMRTQALLVDALCLLDGVAIAKERKCESLT